jgi:hypothetical protein
MDDVRLRARNEDGEADRTLSFESAPVDRWLAVSSCMLASPRSGVMIRDSSLTMIECCSSSFARIRATLVNSTSAWVLADSVSASCLDSLVCDCC